MHFMIEIVFVITTDYNLNMNNHDRIVKYIQSHSESCSGCVANCLPVKGYVYIFSTLRYTFETYVMHNSADISGIAVGIGFKTE